MGFAPEHQDFLTVIFSWHSPVAVEFCPGQHLAVKVGTILYHMLIARVNQCLHWRFVLGVGQQVLDMGTDAKLGRGKAMAGLMVSCGA